MKSPAPRQSLPPMTMPAASGAMSDDVHAAIQTLLMQHQELSIQDICNSLDEDFSKKAIRTAISEMAVNGQLYQGSADDSYAWSG